MYERFAEDRRLLTLSLASGVGIGMGGENAYRAWLTAQDEPSQRSGPAVAGDPTAIARQRAAIGRLQALFAQQPSAALRDAIRRKAD